MFEDEIVSELEPFLTGKRLRDVRACTYAGIPFHAAEVYLNRLISKGYKAAICEQMKTPQAGKRHCP